MLPADTSRIGRFVSIGLHTKNKYSYTHTVCAWGFFDKAMQFTTAGSGADTTDQRQSLQEFKIIGTGSTAVDVDTVTCACRYPSMYISYDSGGCLPCVKADSAFYILNFCETVLESNHHTY